MNKPVLVDMDAVQQWNAAIPALALERLRAADRIEFAHSVSVSGTPPRGHVWMGTIRYPYAGQTYELRVPMHALIFRSEE